MGERIHKAAFELFKISGENWDAIPDWAATVVEGGMPYYGVPRNGSLKFTLGFSVVSQEAHLRNLLERAEGRTME